MKAQKTYLFKTYRKFPKMEGFEKKRGRELKSYKINSFFIDKGYINLNFKKLKTRDIDTKALKNFFNRFFCQS